MTSSPSGTITIGAPDSGCPPSFDPPNISGDNPAGAETWTWEESTDGGSTWTLIGGAIAASYDPGSISTTTQYRRIRKVTGECPGISNIITYTVNTLPTAGAPTLASVCTGLSVNIAGNPSGGSGTYTTHAWTITNAGGTGATDGSNLSNANAETVTFNSTGLTAGIVTLSYTVTDNNGCTGSKTVTVTFETPPSTTGVTICQGAASQPLTATTVCPGGTTVVPFDASGPFIVPTGVTSITVKMWGAGGGGGAGGSLSVGGNGGGGGFSEATLSVTPSETLNVTVGTMGNLGTPVGNAGGGGSGGGHSEIDRSGTRLIIAAGGGGGGGGDNSSSTAGGAGGAGGGVNGLAGGASLSANGGGGGTASSGGGAGTGGTVNGVSGALESGGAGGNGSSGTGGGAAGGAEDGGNGGAAVNNFGAGAGGGGGYYGGGGGSSAASGNAGGGGGGGGSSYVSGTSTSLLAGTGTVPGNSGDSDRDNGGNGGNGGSLGANGIAGTNGRVIVTYTIANDIEWFADPTGGSSIYTGSSFDPVTDGPLTNTNTPGTYTYYAQCSLAADCRTATTFVIVADPSAPTLDVATPANGSTVCVGQDISATFNLGSDGLSCTDEYQYSTNSGGSYSTYVPGTAISTTGLAGQTVIIQTRRNCTGNGCDGAAETFATVASWAVVAQPVGPTLLAKTPSSATVCIGTSVSATFTDGSGGTGCTDDYTVSIDGGAPVTYTSGSPVGGTATSSIVIQGRRANCSGSGCNGTSYVTLASWTVDAQPVVSDEADQTLCNTSTFTMTQSTPGVGTGVWTVEDGSATITTPGSPITTITGVAAGTSATVRWTVTNGTCSAFDEVTLTNHANPSATASAPSPYNGAQISCFPGQGTSNDGSATVIASGGTPGYTYDWNGSPTGDGTETITGLVAGTYTVIVTDANLCFTTTMVTLTGPTEIMAFTCGYVQDECQLNEGEILVVASGGTGTLNASWTAACTIPPGPQGPGGPSSVPVTFTGLAGNCTYSIKVTDANGCIDQ